MAIIASEVQLFRSAEVSDLVTNGGRLSANQSVNNVSENVFPDVPQSERTAGSVKYRKMFVKVASATDETLFNTRLFFNRITPGDDVITIFAATQTDTQNDIATPVLYGVGKLNANVLSGDTSFDILTEDAASNLVFRVGDVIRIANKATILSAGTEEFRVIDTLSFVANLATITFLDPLANSYLATDTYVSSGLDVGDIVGTFNTFVTTTVGSGDYNSVASPVVVDSVGGVADDWTLTFTSANNFDCVGAVLGAVGSGTNLSNFAPTNTDFAQPYFTIPSAGYSGVFQTGDTITFSTLPAAAAIWYKRDVPAGAAAIAGNFIDLIINGENV